METERRSYCTYCDDYGHDIIDHKDSGPMCVCGHFLDDHHRSWLRGGYELAEECEFYGWNEFGGSMQNAEGKWVEHCYRFRKKDE